MRAQVIQRFDPLYPTNNIQHNAELGQLLVYLEAPGIAGKLLRLIVPVVYAFNELICFPLSLCSGRKFALRPALCMGATLAGTVVPIEYFPLVAQVLHSGSLVSFSHHSFLSVVLQP